MRKFCFVEIEWHCLVLFNMREKSHCGHYTSGVKVNNTWKITNFLTALPNSLNGTAGPAPELITETAEIMIQQSVLQELEKQKAKLTIAQEEEKPDPNRVKSQWGESQNSQIKALKKMI